MSTFLVAYRGMVNGWEVDEMGHLNVRFYVQKANHATAHFLNACGAGPQFRRDNGLCVRVVDHHIRFLREARPGTPLYVQTGALAADEAGITMLHEVRNGITKEVCATITGNVSLTEGLTDRFVAMPNEIGEAATQYKVDMPGYAQPKGIDAPAPQHVPDINAADAMGLIEISRMEVRPDRLDAEGSMATEHFIGALSDGIPNMLTHFAVDRAERLQSGVGGAALEYRLFYFNRLLPGDLLFVRSGLTDVGNKTFHHAHWFFDGDANPIASAAAVAVTFDLKERKSLPMPDAMRAAYTKNVVKGFGI